MIHSPSTNVFLRNRKEMHAETCQPNDGINDPAEQGAGAAEEPGYQIKLENAYQSPVDTADDGQNQRKGIHILTSISHPGC